jgi:hypothetical protein
MRVASLSLIIFLFSFGAFAQTPSLSKEKFCADRKDDKFIKELTLDSANLMPFRNKGGIANGGICWWHSRFAWKKGLSGSSKVSPAKIKEIMDQIFEEVEVKKNIAFNKLQVPGIIAHAWLVVHMEKVLGGYNLEILDSNFPSATEIYRYREGDTSINYHGYFHFTPYLEQTRGKN